MNQGRSIITGRRPYQIEARDNVLRGFIQAHAGKGPFRRQLGVLATGGGKTVIFGDVAADYAARGQGVLVLADQRELVDQAAGSLLEFAGLYADIEQGPRRASPMSKVVVASMQSMAERLDRFAPDRFGIVIADEADRSMAPQWQKVLSHFHDHAHIFGLTATPERADKKNVLTYYEDIAFERGLYDLIGEGFLSPVTVRQEALKMDLTGVGTSQTEGETDYSKADLGALLEPCFDQICQLLIEHALNKGRRKVLAFLPLIETSKKFVEACYRNGINARHVDGKMPNRDEIVAAHKRNEFWLLSNAMMLNRGYNDPEIDTILPLRFTKSASLYRQMIGRGTRIWCPHRCPCACEHEGRKKDLLLFDFLFGYARLGPQRPSNLIAETQEEADAITKVLEQTADKDQVLDLQFAAEKAANEREIALLKALEKAGKGGKRKGRTFDAQSFAIRLKQRDLIDYEPLTRWDQEPPSEKQVSLLVKWGFAISSVKSKGHASKLLNVIFARQRHGLASFGQVKYLNAIGDEHAEKRTRQEAQTLLDRHSQYKAGRIGRDDIFQGFEAAAHPEVTEEVTRELHHQAERYAPPAPTPPQEAANGYDSEDDADPDHYAALAEHAQDPTRVSYAPEPPVFDPSSDRIVAPDVARAGFAALREKLTQGQLF